MQRHLADALHITGNSHGRVSNRGLTPCWRPTSVKARMPWRSYLLQLLYIIALGLTLIVRCTIFFFYIRNFAIEQRMLGVNC